MFIFFYISLFILGTILGSFINVLVVRGHDQESLLGRSHCVFCHKIIPAKYLIPVVGFLLSGRKCFSCSKPISIRYFLGEVSLGLLLVFLGMNFGPVEISGYFLAVGLLVITLYYISYYDILYQEIPLVSLILLGLVITMIHVTNIFPPWSTTEILAGLIPGTVFLIIWGLSRGRLIGFGDILLMFLIGYHVGFIGAISVITVSFWMGALYIAGLAIYKTFITHSPLKTMKHMTIPFGPFLCASWLLTVLFKFNFLSKLLSGLL